MICNIVFFLNIFKIKIFFIIMTFDIVTLPLKFFEDILTRVDCINSLF